MSYDALRFGLFVAANDKIKIYKMSFTGCFGQEIGQFCSGCGLNDDPTACSGCYTAIGFLGTNQGTCTYSIVGGGFFAPKLDLLLVCDVCNLPRKFNYAYNACACPINMVYSTMQNRCSLLPEGCLRGQDNGGFCLLADYGYYVSANGNAVSC